MGQESSFKLNGEKIRELRRERAWSSTALAEYIDVTPAYISQIERNLVEPSLSVLRKLAKALNVELLALMEYGAPEGVFISTGEQEERTFPQAHAKYQLRTPAVLKSGEKPDISFMVVKIESGQTDYDEMVCHDFVEFCYVLEGCIEYRTPKRTYRLEEGDSIYIQKNVSHLLYNPGPEVATLVGVLGSLHPHWQQEDGEGTVRRDDH
ncbi:helix-turn-helix domain-containing protein [Paenibacillus senegalimassiliensis]|uniref:helix-turn-helix domain-containing protein n=1 Tax=Paenibacillus senegalimassiliensis TaxID=1737426 RepID=UPI00073EB9B9|nr:XRE family transcriptional regulator [Paenibacillus senegalimassiliensis]